MERKDSRPVLGILGGSFDPIHRGHLALAQACIAQRLAARVLLVPAGQAPLREPPRASAKHRLAMCQLACADIDRVCVSPIEVNQRRAYTADTLAKLAADCPGWQLALIIGTDLLTELHKWRDIDGILERARILAYTRPGFPAEANTPRGASCQVIAAATPEISSSMVRNRLARSLPVSDLLPEAVAGYIEAVDLYRL